MVHGIRLHEKVQHADQLTEMPDIRATCDATAAGASAREVPLSSRKPPRTPDMTSWGRVE